MILSRVIRLSFASRSKAPIPDRAVDVHPAQSGETYSYQVDKFWIVRDVREATVLLVTRRGKERSVSRGDLRLRHARWWERWFYSDRFPKLSQLADLAATSTSLTD